MGEQRSRVASRKTGRSKGKTVLGPRERRRITQLVVCLALFLAVFIGKGVFPERINALREQVLGLLRGDTDFQAVFADLGQSISKGEPVLETLGDAWNQMLGGEEAKPGGTAGENALYAAQVAWLSGFGRQAGTGTLGLKIDPQATPAVAATPAPQPEATPEPTPTPEPAVEHVDYTGPALPDNTSMDKYRLDVGETVSPVMGVLTSPFGWREHPVDGEEKFHNGVDLAVNTGTQVKAFADGVVEYIGDDPDQYGLYLQISHANGVKSFYAHCSQLLVSQGQTVKAGDTVALSGDTGNTTCPRLHLELRFNGVRVNPIYYSETN